MSIIANYLCGLIISGDIVINISKVGAASPFKSTQKKMGLFIAIIFNLAFLAYFKYSNFVIENYNQFLVLLDLGKFQVKEFTQVILPLGISFFTFQAISYSVDIYKNEAKAKISFIDFACYLTMFPKLIAGPITPYRKMENQLTKRSVNIDMIAFGIKRFIFGLSKKVFIANTLAIPVNQIFSLPDNVINPAIAWTGGILYTLQIYFDFAGYSDMAIGLGQMFGFALPENFNYPYITRSIQDFWRRWHISLSSWLRDYLYIPLGGNRVHPSRTYLNLITVFFLCGLWHGANWTFIAWGLFHGFFLILERAGLGPLLKRQPFCAHFYSLFAIIFGWVLFRSESLNQALVFWNSMVDIPKGIDLTTLTPYITKEVAATFGAALLFSTPIYPFLRNMITKNLARGSESTSSISPFLAGAEVTFLITVFVSACITLAASTYNPFIYFRF